MSLAHGRPYRALPGPSVLPDRVIRAMQRPAPDIYEGELVELMPGLLRDLNTVAGSRTARCAIYIANGHGAWEAALANLVGPGDRVLALSTGRFAEGWAQVARGLGVEADVLTAPPTRPADPDVLEARLRADTAREIRAVLVCQTDTATSVLSDIAAMRTAIDAAGHPALLVVDCIASLAADRFLFDDWGVDVMVGAGQKGLMTPPGLGFVWIGEKAAEARAARARVPLYWDWQPRIAPEEFYQYFWGTAPTHHLFALRAALDMIHEEGIEAVWARHDALARTIWAAVEAWSEGGAIRPFLPDPAVRSRAVTTLAMPGAEDLRRWVREETGLTLGIGLGLEPADGYFRIGHMGHVSAQMILGALGAIEAALSALDIPHGAGALEAAAGVVARSAGGGR